MDTSLLYKPPLPDPKTVTVKRTERGLKATAINDSKRAKRHAGKEAAREPSERVMERQDLGETEKPRYTQSTLWQLNSIMSRWSQFHLDKLADADGERYFKPDGPLPTLILIRQFFLWLVDGSQGKVATSSLQPSSVTNNKNLSQRSAKTYSGAFFSALRYYNRAVEKDIISQTKLWIEGTLTDIADLNREPRMKSTAYYNDVELVIKAMWQWTSLALFKSLDNIVAMTIIVNLLIDGASRIGELIPRAPDHRIAEAYLKWQDLEFWVIEDEVGDQTISCIVCSKWLKNHTANIEGFKKFTCRLLSPHLVLQDSCRLLTILALHFGYFKHFRTWSELMNVQTTRTGSRIQLKDSCLNKMVVPGRLRRREDDAALSSLTCNHVATLVKGVAYLAGFRENLNMTSLRRGDAYILDKHVKERETARTLMGQRTHSRAFSAYLSKTSVTDVQALTKNIAPVDVTLMSSLRLGVCEGSPTQISKAGIESVETDPEYEELCQQVDIARQNCHEEFGSVAAAQRSKAISPLFNNWLKVKNAKRAVHIRLLTLVFNREREQAIQDLTTAKPSDPARFLNASTDDETLLNDVGHADIEAMSDNGESSGDGNLAEVQKLMEDEEMSEVEEVSGGEEEDVISDMTAGEAYREHRIYRQELDAMFGGLDRSHTKMRSFSPYYNMLGESYEALTAVDVSGDYVVEEMLNILSSEVFVDDVEVVKHQKDAKAEAQRLWVEYLHTLPPRCLWTPRDNKPAYIFLPPCNHDLTADKASQAHIFRHLTKCKNLTCKWDACGEQFTNYRAFFEHAQNRHQLYPSYIPDKLYTCCRYCNEWVFGSTYSTVRRVHFESHLLDALLNAQQYGYCGVYIAKDVENQRECIAPQCVFHLHDETVSAEDRIAGHGLVNQLKGLCKHLYTHFKEMRDMERYYCPASPASDAHFPLCSHDSPMTRSQLWQHVQHVHYLRKFPDLADLAKQKRPQNNFKPYDTSRVSATVLQPVPGNTV